MTFDTTGIVDPILFDFPTDFYSERLYIRMPRVGDGIRVHDSIMASLEDFKEWFPFASEPQTPEKSETIIRKAISSFFLREDLRLLVFLRDHETLVGSSGLHRMDWSVPKFEIGYWIDSRYRGHGYMTEAVDRISRFAFEDLHAKRVEICCDSTNLRSKAIPERLNFHLEAKQENFRRSKTDGRLVHRLVYSKTLGIVAPNI